MKIDIEKKNGQWQIWERVSLQEFTAHIKNDIPVWDGLTVPKEFAKFTPVAASQRSSRRDGRNHQWDLGADYKKAAELADTGWTDAPDLNKLKNVVAHAAGLHGQEQELHRGTHGTMVDMGAFAAGHPEAFFDFAPEPAQPKIKIAYEAATACGVRAEDMALRGAVVYTIADWLKPHAVIEVSAFLTFHDGDIQHTTEIVVCNEEYPLDSNALAFFAAHPALFRRLYFAWMELHPNYWRNQMSVPGHYAYPGNVEDPERIPEVYFSNVCPRTPADAGSAVRATAKRIRKDFFNEAS